MGMQKRYYRKFPYYIKPSSAIKILLLTGTACGTVTSHAVAAQEKQTYGVHHTSSHSPSKKKTLSTKTVSKKQTNTTPLTPAPASITPPAVTKQSNAKVLSATAPSTEAVTVTGTRLSQTRLSNVMAGSTLDAQQLRARGYTNLGTALLRENPAFSVPSNSQIGGQSSWGAGQTFTGLFALGDQRTLTLIDGMRMVGGASASLYGAGSGSQVDVGTIPTSLIKKIDTKYGGAGAAYGADAVAGVVNYQLDDHYKGVELNAQGNWTQKLDAPQEKIYFKAGTGFDHDKGGVVFDVEYRNAGGMSYNDRRNIIGNNAETYLWPTLDSTSPYDYVLTRNNRFSQLSESGIPLVFGSKLPSRFGQATGGIAAQGGGVLKFSDDGKSLVPLTGALTRSNYYTAGGNGVSFEDYDQLFTPSSSLNLTTLGHYDFTQHLHATWQGWYQRGQAESAVNQSVYYSSAMYGDPMTLSNFHDYPNGNLALSTSNPFLTSSERSTIVNALAAAGQPTDTFYMSRMNEDLKEGAFTTTNQMFRFQGGLNGDFNAVGRHFEWKLRGEYSKYMNDTLTRVVDTRNMLNALNAVTMPDGSIGCAPGYVNSTAKTLSSTCSPLNLFGRNQITPAALAYTTSMVDPKNSNAQRDLQAEISSTVLKLPAGDVRWDLGYEHRRESYNFNSGAILRGEKQAEGSYASYGDNIPIPDTYGSYGTHEAFGELDIPIVSPNMNVPGAYSISATSNGRYTHNSITGNYWTYMFGGSWWPTQDFGFSGNYAQSVRNPSVTEMFSPQSRVMSMASDPCAAEDITSGPDPVRRAMNCAKAGVPSGFTSNIVNYSVYGISGGNPALKNETSKSYTGSIHLLPRFIPGFQLDASFIDVKINNEIEDLDISSIMSACYDSKSYPNQYCGYFSRDPSTKQVTGFQEGYVNIASQHMQALNATLNYSLPLRRFGQQFEDWGGLHLQVNYNHYVRNSQTYLGVTYPEFGSTGQPQDSFTANLDYVRGPLFVQWQTMYYGPSKVNVNAGEYAQEANQRNNFIYFNTTIGYHITKNFDANFMMNNVTNALPAHAGTVNLTRYYEAILGRSFQLQLGAHF